MGRTISGELTLVIDWPAQAVRVDDEGKSAETNCEIGTADGDTWSLEKFCMATENAGSETAAVAAAIDPPATLSSAGVATDDK
jgi:hypothetical protein